MTSKTSRTCGNPGCVNLAFQRCSRCKKMPYCSPGCQATHWQIGHKKDCAKKVSPSSAFTAVFAAAIDHSDIEKKWEVDEGKRRQAQLEILIRIWEHAKHHLGKIGVKTKVPVRLSFEKAPDDNTKKKELGHYDPIKERILIRDFTPSDENDLLWTIIHELLHGWFHKTLAYPRGWDKVDEEEEGACEVFTHLLLSKRFNCVYSLSIHESHIELYRTSFKKLCEKLKIDCSRVYEYDQIRTFLDTYIRIRKPDPSELLDSTDLLRALIHILDEGQ